MPFDRDEVNAAMNGRRSAGLDSHLARAAQRAAVHASAMTGVAQWDWFLSYIEKAIEDFEPLIQNCRETLENPTVVEYSDLMRTKLMLERYLGARDALISVRDLPKDLIKNGEQARALLDRFPGARHTDGPPPSTAE